MKNVSINLYEFGELNSDARVRAINEQTIFLNSIDREGRTFEDSVAIESIEANEYLFFIDGTMAHCTTYTGKHEKAGTTEFHLHGANFLLS
jgi:hypothetical protein